MEDPRLEFISEYVTKSLKVRPERFSKLYEVEENKQLMNSFFDKPEYDILFVIAAPGGGALSVTLDWPRELLKGKVAYFQKKNDRVPRDLPPRTTLIAMDMSGARFEQFACFVNEVIYLCVIFACCRYVKNRCALHSKR